MNKFQREIVNEYNIYKLTLVIRRKDNKFCNVVMVIEQNKY